MNKDASNYIFSTEGHIFKLDSLYRDAASTLKAKAALDMRRVESVTISQAYNMTQVSMLAFPSMRTLLLVSIIIVLS